MVDLENCSKVCHFRAHQNPIANLQFNPNGRLVGVLELDFFFFFCVPGERRTPMLVGLFVALTSSIGALPTPSAAFDRLSRRQEHCCVANQLWTGKTCPNAVCVSENHPILFFVFSVSASSRCESRWLLLSVPWFLRSPTMPLEPPWLLVLLIVVVDYPILWTWVYFLFCCHVDFLSCSIVSWMFTHFPRLSMA